MQPPASRHHHHQFDQMTVFEIAPCQSAARSGKPLLSPPERKLEISSCSLVNTRQLAYRRFLTSGTTGSAELRTKHCESIQSQGPFPRNTGRSLNSPQSVLLIALVTRAVGEFGNTPATMTTTLVHQRNATGPVVDCRTFSSRMVTFQIHDLAHLSLDTLAP